MTIPTGYYDAKVRNRSKKSPTQIVTECRGPCEQPSFAHPWDDLDSSDEANEDVMPAPKGSAESRVEPGLIRSTSNTYIDPFSRVPKSPPLSVTSRMRRCSEHSTITELTTSISGTASSKHTSFTSSVPSVPSEDPRNLSCSPFHEKKLARRSKPREPESVRGQELVPSYDELYG
ncbi:uncharacterized protein ACLA_047750 [Aspergillus clavatus NRRL 1]|uniref:Uncharacterized protein n=1 Tax=Aspergillus clavatus (strain ATCC 1007 / CBS 513.65 / DSM 816 / NCTC 3887 / NRRL 1 / QM 1276 / 107) TaxID=344612 RepID=A1CHF1_ASPCL|nr:uncharacterized protein ACLA_047750 [Aspergillus clavatus NRRL 1]EAW10306.1 conserved hypothetical protein [Aspergillus clavatus NRRL 1]